MTTRSWVGCGLAVLLFVIFGAFVHRGCDITATWAWAFGGGALFCGLLIDFADFMAVLRAVRGQPSPPPPPGGPEGQFPTGEGK